MNIDNAKTLIAQLKQCKYLSFTDITRWLASPERRPNNTTSFNMTCNAYECGSPACIAGHCASLMGHDPKLAGVGAIEEYLDIDHDPADDLFWGRFTRTRTEAQKKQYDHDPDVLRSGLRVKDAIAELEAMLAAPPKPMHPARRAAIEKEREWQLGSTI